MTVTIKREIIDSEGEEQLSNSQSEDSSDNLKNWECNKCGQKFVIRANFAKHLNKDCGLKRRHRRNEPPVNKSFTCGICQEVFSSVKLLSKHNTCCGFEEMEHFTFNTNTGMNICSWCSLEFKFEDEIKEHVRTVHKVNFFCDVCKEEFPNAFIFACHKQRHDKNKFYDCPFCDFKTKLDYSISQHIRSTHYNKYLKFCKTCKKGFNSLLTFKEHENVHLGVKPFACVVCKKAFFYSQYLRKHQLSIHKVQILNQVGKNQCPTCFKSFSKFQTLKKHLDEGHDKKPKEKRFICDGCGKGFISGDKLVQHYRIHTGEKPFKCQYCDKSFTLKSTVVVHERTHTGERPFVCQDCGKAFSQNTPLKVHRSSFHNGEKKEVCLSCEKRFVSKATLNSHKKKCRGKV